MNVTILADALAPVLRELVDSVTSPILRRLDALEEMHGKEMPALETLRRDVAALPDRFERQIAEALPAPIDFDAMVRAAEERLGAKFADLPKAATAEEVAALMPAPKDGRDGAPGADGRDGVDGKSVDVDEVATIVAEQVAAAFATVPVPKDGRNGADGKDGAAGPDGKDGASGERGEKGDTGGPGPEGQPGKDGADGASGRDGKSITVDDVAPLINELTTRKVAEIPRATDGKDGRDGKDGVSLAGVLKDHEGCLVFTLSDGTMSKVGLVDGAPGKDGSPGRDVDPEFVRAAVQDEVQSQITAPLADAYKGVWRPATYKRGDVVTWAGSLFIASADTEAKPETNDDWKLAVKRGRDGKDGEAPKPPPTVKLK